jgi:hypothetical protein
MAVLVDFFHGFSGNVGLARRATSHYGPPRVTCCPARTKAKSMRNRRWQSEYKDYKKYSCLRLLHAGCGYYFFQNRAIFR